MLSVPPLGVLRLDLLLTVEQGFDASLPWFCFVRIERLLDAAKPFAAGPAPATGERVSVKLLDGETIVGIAMPHTPGEPFFVVPAVATGNVRRIWISPKAVRTATKV